MKLRYINPHNVEHLVPDWLVPSFVLAKYLDGVLCDAPHLRPIRLASVDNPICAPYWLHLQQRCGQWDAEVVRLPDGFRDDDEDREEALEFLGTVVLDSPEYRLVFPLGNVCLGVPTLKGSHTIYVHSVVAERDSDKPHRYVGITGRTWYERLAEHRSEAARGSKLLFHRALREHGGVKATRIALSGLTFEQAMEREELFTLCRGGTLYPNGLNMIPGGFAGLRYLATLGRQARTLDERDAALSAVMDRERLTDGSPNPLCAARWASDKEYVNSVICGHSGRLDVTQVRNIRMLSASGYEDSAIAGIVGDTAARVRRVVDNRRYARVT